MSRPSAMTRVRCSAARRPRAPYADGSPSAHKIESRAHGAASASPRAPRDESAVAWRALSRSCTGIHATLVGCRRSEEHTSELQSLAYLVCRLLLEKKKKKDLNCTSLA